MMVYDIPGRVIIVPGLWGKVEYISENYWEHFSEASDGQRCFQENAKECCSEYKEKIVVAIKEDIVKHGKFEF